MGSDKRAIRLILFIGIILNDLNITKLSFGVILRYLLDNDRINKFLIR
jgi:hypothetical protein